MRWHEALALAMFAFIGGVKVHHQLHPNHQQEEEPMSQKPHPPTFEKRRYPFSITGSEQTVIVHNRRDQRDVRRRNAPIVRDCGIQRPG